MTSIVAKHVYCGVPGTVRGEATHLSADPTGKTDAIAFASGRVAVVRSISNPLECGVFNLHASRVTAVRFAPDGLSVASGDETGNVRIWDRAKLKQTMDVQVMSGPVRDIAFAPDAKHIVVSGETRGAYAKAVKVPSGSLAGVCSGHTKRVVACDVSGEKPFAIVTASEDMSGALFVGPPINELNMPTFLKQHKGFVNDARFSPDSALLALASSDRTISIVDGSSGDVVKILEGHTGSVTGLAWMPDSKSLVSSSNDKTLRIWRVDTGECMSTVSFGTNVQDMQVGCAYSAPANASVSLSLRGDLSVIEDGASSPVRVLRGHSKKIVGLAVVGSKAYSADYSGLIVAWDIGVGPSSAPFEGKGPATSLCALDANSSVVATLGQDGKIFLTPTESQQFQTPIGIRGGGVGISVPSKADSAISCVAINESRVVVVDAAGANVAAELEFAKGEFGTSVAVNSDGSLVAVGVRISAGGGEIRYLKLTGGTTLASEGSPIRVVSPPNALAFSSDDSVLAAGLQSRHVYMYKVGETSALEGGGVAHTARVDALDFDPTGTRVASGGIDGSICIWKIGTDEDPVRMAAAHRGGLTGIAFVDSNNLLTSGSDSCLRSWTL